MPKRPRDQSLGKLLVESMKEAVQIAQGKLAPARVHTVTARQASVRSAPAYTAKEVVRVREKMGVSQSVFALALNVSAATVRSWEQGTRIPEGPSKRLLEIAERAPHVVIEGVSVQGKTGPRTKLGVYLSRQRLQAEPQTSRRRARAKA